MVTSCFKEASGLKAHSARNDRGIAAQPYSHHVLNVKRLADHFAKQAGQYSQKYFNALETIVRLSAEFHDAGKLIAPNQDALLSSTGKLPVNHSYPGGAILLSLCQGSTAHLIAAILVFSHHIGLPNLPEAILGKPLDQVMRDPSSLEITQEDLVHLLELHRSIVDSNQISSLGKFETSPTLFRIALSCLVDADHTDTANNYGHKPKDPVPLKAAERLRSLDNHILSLPHDELKTKIYLESKNSKISEPIVACDSPVATGKTFSVMAYGLSLAKKINARHIFVIPPYTNIIEQTVEAYKTALVLPGENPDEVIGDHYNRAEFDHPSIRHLSFLWKTPIIVTSAVQFFETLASCKTSRLKKLNQLPGSVIIIDESHAALPIHLWPIAWKWLQELSNCWGCRIILSSGSLTRFWEDPEIIDPPVKLQQILFDETRELMTRQENNRIEYKAIADALCPEDISVLVSKLKGPRILIFNTLLSAASIANHLAQKFGRDKIEHLSTALTPSDRARTLKRIKARLNNKNDNDWSLVATSCVEAGVDLSFRSGIREHCSLTSCLQVAGRINRRNEYSDGILYSIRLKFDNKTTKCNPEFNLSSKILCDLFRENKIGPEFCHESLRREIREARQTLSHHRLIKLESKNNFVTVNDKFKVIDEESVTVLVDPDIIKRFESGKKILPQELQNGSVQIHKSKLTKWRTYPLVEDELYKWTLTYDDFSGIMKGILSLSVDIE